MAYIIGSWNIREFGSVKGKHDLGKLADVILSEGFDIVALQEAKQAKAIEMLCNRLPGWECSHGYSKSGGTGDYGLGYLWNARRVRECSRNSRPDFIRRYKSHMKFERDPYYGRFTSNGLLGGAFFEIRLISVHLCQTVDGGVNMAKRLEEYRLATTEIYEYISTHAYGNHMPAYTIVIGDYNLKLDDCRRNEVAGRYFAQTFIEDKTTLRKSKDNIPGDYVSDYDHFSYNENRFVGARIYGKKVDTVAVYMGNDFDKHWDELSNHVPIKLELELNTRR